jgi:hypothetical protein
MTGGIWLNHPIDAETGSRKKFSMRAATAHGPGTSAQLVLTVRGRACSRFFDQGNLNRRAGFDPKPPFAPDF